MTNGAAVSLNDDSIESRSNLAVPSDHTPEYVFHSFENGSSWAADVWKDVGQCLGRGIATLAHIFKPDLVVLGGGISLGAKALLRSAQETLSSCGDDHYTSNLKIETSLLGSHAGLIGAAFLAHRDWEAKNTNKRRIS